MKLRKLPETLLLSSQGLKDAHLLGSFKFLSASAAHQSCLEILKQNPERDPKVLKAEILEPGEKLLRSYFPHSDFHNLSKSEKINFSLTAKHEIIETMISQGTVVFPVPYSTAFAILGGKSRIGRVAHNLGRQGSFVFAKAESLQALPQGRSPSTKWYFNRCRSLAFLACSI